MTFREYPVNGTQISFNKDKRSVMTGNKGEARQRIKLNEHVLCCYNHTHEYIENIK